MGAAASANVFSMKCFLLVLLGSLSLLSQAHGSETWNQGLADRLVQLSIRCVQKDSPHFYDKFETKRGPEEMHPAFFGCFDWHSAVHGHWAMLRLIRNFPHLASREKILNLLDKHLRADLIQGEIKHFNKHSDFERPYGWGWFLRLAAEVSESQAPNAKVWAAAIAPLENLVRQRMIAFLSVLPVPFREGEHVNTAYALLHVFHYARVKGDRELENSIRSAAIRLYKNDRNCPLSYEPSAGDFISPCFVEAVVMSEVMPEKKFRSWWAGFLPKIDAKQLQPVLPLDPHDPVLGHLIGLMFFKSWAMDEVAKALPKENKTALMLRAAATQQTNTALRLMFDSGYGGEHWLASFAIFRFTE